MSVHCNWCADLRRVTREQGWGNWIEEPCPVCVTGELQQINACTWVRRMSKELPMNVTDANLQSAIREVVEAARAWADDIDTNENVLLARLRRALQHLEQSGIDKFPRLATTPDVPRGTFWNYNGQVRIGYWDLLGKYEQLAQAVLLFHRDVWTTAERKEWLKLTGKEEATTKVLCDLARFIITDA